MSEPAQGMALRCERCGARYALRHDPLFDPIYTVWTHLCDPATLQKIRAEIKEYCVCDFELGCPDDCGCAHHDPANASFFPKPPPAPKMGCNRHKNCTEADQKAMDEGKPLPIHCSDENCEDCFGT